MVALKALLYSKHDIYNKLSMKLLAVADMAHVLYKIIRILKCFGSRSSLKHQSASSFRFRFVKCPELIC